MWHSRTLNHGINNMHHRALRIAYQDKKSSVHELLQKGKSVSIHMKNLQYLDPEIFKDLYRATLRQIEIKHKCLVFGDSSRIFSDIPRNILGYSP